MNADAPLLLADPPASGFDFTQCVPNKPLIIARLNLKASEVPKLIEQFDPKGETADLPITLIADTFAYDPVVLPSMMVKIIARHVTVVNKTPVVISPKLPLTSFHFDIAAGRTTGGPITVYPRNEKPLITYTTLSTSQTAPSYFFITQNCYGNGVFSNSTNYLFFEYVLKDVARTPALWNRLKALFPLAVAQLYVPEEKAEGIARLQWISDLSRGLASQTHPLAAEASLLNFQASSLLGLSVAAGGSRPVPVWSDGFLHDQIDSQLSLLERYDAKIQNLEIREDIQLTVESLGEAWKDVTKADEAALKVSAKQTDEEIAAQTQQYHDLLWAYEMQETSLGLVRIEFKSGIAQTAIIKTTKAVLEIAGAVAKMGAAAYGAGVPDVGSAEKAAAAAAKEAAAIDNELGIGDIGSAISDAILGPTIEALTKLKNDLQKVMKIGKILGKALGKVNEIDVAQGLDGRGEIALPELAEVASLDPEAGWNIFIIRVEVMLREHITDTDGGGAIAGAKEFYIGLVALAEYGKALGTKSQALARLASRRLEISAQLEATRFAVQRWERLQASAQTNREKIALARSILQESELATKRSLFVLAEGYRAAYAYANLAEKPLQLRFAMNFLQLKAEFLSLQKVIESFFATPRLAQPVDTGYFTIPVVRAGTSPLPAGPHALLRTDGKPQLTFSISLENPPFKSRLISGVHSAYFIKEAWFYLEGVTPDSSGVVALRVSTNGNYENGYGPAQPMRFASQGYALDFAYVTKPGDDSPVPFSPWRPIGKTKGDYMMPTPFTGWIATLERFTSVDALKAIRVRFNLQRLDAKPTLP